MRLSDVLTEVGRPVAYYPGLVKHLGSINAVLFFCQIFYWQKKTDNSLGVYKVAEEIEEETGMTYREQSTARKHLVSRGVLVETHKRLEHRIYFKINVDRLDEIMSTADCGVANPRNALLSSGELTNTHSDPTENTTEITTENKPSCAPSAHDADPMPDLFDRFWKLYPNKKNKANARKTWSKLKVTDDLFDQIIAGLARYCESPEWTKDGGQFIPHPTTWLNGKRWEDEVALPTVNAHKSPGASRHSEFDDSDNDLSWMEQLRK